MKPPLLPRRHFLAATLCLVAWVTHVASGQLVRQANTTLTLPSELPAATGYTTANAIPFAGGGGMGFTNPMCTAFPPGVTDRLFVLERGTDYPNNIPPLDYVGRIQMVNFLTTPNPSQSTFMDLESYLESAPVNTPLEARGDNSENGMLSMVFHPNYNQNGYFYVWFSLSINGQPHQRLARFKATDPDPLSPTRNFNAATVADPATMTPMLTIRDEAGNHNGGDLAFGADGCLYLSLGDEGGGGDQYNNARFINKDFWGQMIRIAVADYNYATQQDEFPANTVLPNAHSQAGPLSSAVHAGTYRVPADNPFIGYTSWHGLAIDPATVRTEIFATGLRNPFRFTIDPPTGRIFLGDVGQNLYEEVDIIVKGGDYGWSWREGLHDFVGEPAPTSPPAGYDTFRKDPIYEYDHTNDGTGNDAIIYGNSVCGGLIYRGNQLPELQGKYIFCDIFGGGGIIAALTETSPGVWTGQQLAIRAQIADFGTDPRDGEPLLCSLQGTIYKLQRTFGGGTAPPATLSATGAFSNLTTLTPNTGIVPYDPNVSFWSDYAIKSRWFCIKNTTDTIGFSTGNNWTFPADMVWVKHFDFELERGNPATRRKLETRFLVKTATDVYGLSYRWNNIGSGTQTNATLVGDSGETMPIPGSIPAQTWRFPGRSECVTCHTQVGGHALSFNTPQMNRAHDFGGVSQNQIQALSNAGYFSAPVSGVNNLPAFAPSTDTAQSLEWRVRSYFAVNCVQCHQPGGAAQGMWDARSTTKTDAANLINGLLVNDGGDPANRFAVPGNTTLSMVLKRQQGNGVPRMPPLATNERDLVNEQLVTDWIASLTTRQSFTQWLAAQSPPVGTATDDPDLDGRTNELEYFTRTNPNSTSSGWSYGPIQIVGGNAQIQFTQPAGRAAIVEASSDLTQWHPWNAPGNQPTYPATDTLRTITAPLAGPDHFFRVRFSEP